VCLKGGPCGVPSVVLTFKKDSWHSTIVLTLKKESW
jgi:hypothetical protein